MHWKGLLGCREWYFLLIASLPMVIFDLISLVNYQRGGKCLRFSFLVKGNSLPAPPSGRDWVTSKPAAVGGGPIESQDRDFPSTKCQWSSRRAEEWIEVRATCCPSDEKLSLWTKTWPTAWRCGKETGILPHYYFSWKDLKFTSWKERTSEKHFSGIRVC